MLRPLLRDRRRYRSFYGLHVYNMWTNQGLHDWELFFEISRESVIYRE